MSQPEIKLAKHREGTRRNNSMQMMRVKRSESLGHHAISPKAIETSKRTKLVMVKACKAFDMVLNGTTETTAATTKQQFKGDNPKRKKKERMN
ncbi:hypothetical protein H5410_005469 [Solanum commersonii]|uniref:Uncharacterized protein n=1 Tax=Solanum commersonii TaxID=4109 RepID=A0A9J6A7I2_SOLCO|nr:hypothetical protein H5410_005469 [Solanum commersonii]